MHPDVERVLLTREELQCIVDRLGRQITEDYRDKDLLVVGVLNGAAIFLADLVRAIDLDCRLDFVGVSSYGNTTASGRLTMTKAPSIDPKGQDVLLVEDVLDSGQTLSHLAEDYRQRGAASVAICALLDKPDAHKVAVEADYAGHTVGNEFIVGYGLDYAQRYRNLPYIGVLRPSVYEGK